MAIEMVCAMPNVIVIHASQLSWRTRVRNIAMLCVESKIVCMEFEWEIRDFDAIRKLSLLRCCTRNRHKIVYRCLLWRICLRVRRVILSSLGALAKTFGNDASMAAFDLCFRCKHWSQMHNCNLGSSNECCHCEVSPPLCQQINWNIVRSKLNNECHPAERTVDMFQ